MIVLDHSLFKFEGATRSMTIDISVVEHADENWPKGDAPGSFGIKGKTGAVKEFEYSGTTGDSDEVLYWEFIESDADSISAVTVLIFND